MLVTRRLTNATVPWNAPFTNRELTERRLLDIAQEASAARRLPVEIYKTYNDDAWNNGTSDNQTVVYTATIATSGSYEVNVSLMNDNGDHTPDEMLTFQLKRHPVLPSYETKHYRVAFDVAATVPATYTPQEAQRDVSKWFDISVLISGYHAFGDVDTLSVTPASVLPDPTIPSTKPGIVVSEQEPTQIVWLLCECVSPGNLTTLFAFDTLETLWTRFPTCAVYNSATYAANASSENTGGMFAYPETIRTASTDYRTSH